MTYSPGGTPDWLKMPELPDYVTDTQRDHYYQAILPAWRDKKAQWQRFQDRELAAYQFDKLHLQRDTQHTSTLRAQTENQQRQLDFQRQQSNQQLQFQTQGLQLQRDRMADERSYRNQLLQRQDRQLASDREERARVRADTKQQFQLQLQTQKDQFDKTFAFNEKRAAENDKARIQAQVHAEAGARRQVLSSLGYHNQQDKVGSPLENLMQRMNRNQRKRPRLRSV